MPKRADLPTVPIACAQMRVRDAAALGAAALASSPATKRRPYANMVRPRASAKRGPQVAIVLVERIALGACWGSTH